MTRRLLTALAAGLALTALPAHADPLPTLYDVTEPCASALGQNNVINPVVNPVGDPTVLVQPDDGHTVAIDVLVLLDGVTQTRAEAIFAGVNGPYGEIGVSVVPTYQTVSPGFTNTDATPLIEEARATFPGRAVPAAYDMVEILTAKDITGANLGSAVAGQAYCLGGAHDPRYAFEVSEADNANADLITAHEMGHLFGGQHEYSTCGEELLATSSTAGPGGPPPIQPHVNVCDLMAPDLALVTPHFGSINRRVVRGYALRYADT